MTMQRPLFGLDYDLGWAGFTFTEGSFLSCGISWFTRRWRTGKRKFTHVLLVSGKDTCLEATPKGITSGTLSHYFENPKVQIIFRRPRGWTPEMGQRLVEFGETFAGVRYDYPLIVAHAISNSLLGGAIDHLLGGYPSAWITKLLDGKRAMVCSEYVATVYQSEPSIARLGILRRPAREIKPQEFGDDDGCFDLQ